MGAESTPKKQATIINKKLTTSKSTVTRVEKKPSTILSPSVASGKTAITRIQTQTLTKGPGSNSETSLVTKSNDFKHKRTNSMSLGSLNKPDALTRDNIPVANHRAAHSSKYTQSFIVPSSTFPTSAQEQKEDVISASLKDSLKIMEKIQREFENSAKMNNIDRNMNSFVVNINPDAAYNYSYVSDYEKQIINNNIIETSENRLSNYSKLFNIINTSLKDIKETLLEYKEKKGIYNI